MQLIDDFSSAALYGKRSVGVAVRGRSESGTSHEEAEMPDFDDRSWDGPYDDE